MLMLLEHRDDDLASVDARFAEGQVGAFVSSGLPGFRGLLELSAYGLILVRHLGECCERGDMLFDEGTTCFRVIVFPVGPSAADADSTRQPERPA